jgi:hypothetical protein
MLAAGRRKHCRQIVGSCKVHRIVKSGIGANASLEALRGSIDFSEQLHLEPAIPSLDGLSRRLGPGELTDSEQADRSD